MKQALYILLFLNIFCCTTFAAENCGALLDENPVTYSEPLSSSKRLYNPFNLLNLFYDWITVKDLDIAGEDFFKPKNGEVVIGVNGVKKNKGFTEGLGALVSGKAYDNGVDVFHLQPENSKSFINSLLEIRELAGKPISRLLIVNHGLPGRFKIGTDVISAKWARNNKDLLESLPYDLFEKNATVALIPCLCAAGPFYHPNQGVNAIRKIFSPLLKQGGRVIASRRVTMTNSSDYEHNLPELQMPKWKAFSINTLNKLNKPFEMVAILATFALSDFRSYSKKIEIIEIPVHPTQ